MKCEKCGNNEASVTVRAYVNGHEHDFHLCSDCVKEYSQNINLEGDGNWQAVDINNFDWKKLVEKMMPTLDEIIDRYYKYKMLDDDYRPDPYHLSDKTCPECGNLESNIKLGIFACPNCYNMDQGLSKKVLRKKNNFSGQYKGKYPKKYRKFQDIAVKIKTLQEKLQQSVETEDYEQAQSLKNEIDQLNMKVKN